MTYHFVEDFRLGIKLPVLQKEWHRFDKQTQETILLEWETIRSSIPDRIKELEGIIIGKLEAIGLEENFNKACQLNTEVSELASTINDLWIWYRTNQKVSHKENL